jgi:DNA-directed RNA polymerase subunit RPC12/RpoP
MQNAPGTGGLNYGQYTHPWFTISNQFIPRNLHDLYKWVRYITVQSPTTTEVLRKYATYPITDFNIDTNDLVSKKRYENIFKKMRLKSSLHDIGFGYFSMGNVFISLYMPLDRYLKCGSCGSEYNSKQIGFKYRAKQFTCTCPRCGYKGFFTRRDVKGKNPEEVNVVMWNPEHITVNHNPITGESEYYYNIPNSVRQKIKLGDSLMVRSTPWEMIEAVENNEALKFDNDMIFHLKNISMGSGIDGIGLPPLISLFHLVYYQATLRKANESIAADYLAPLRVVFPQQSSSSGDPVARMSLSSFVGNMEDAFKRHRRDNNHIVIAPVPVGYSALGGEGKNLLITQELQQAEQTSLLGMGVSQELLSGTTNWTSSTVGLRMLRNTLLNYTSQIEEVIDWMVSKISSYFGLEYYEVTLEPFELTDDDVKKQYLVQLFQAGTVSLPIKISGDCSPAHHHINYADGFVINQFVPVVATYPSASSSACS